MSIIKHIPNTITSMNLVCGILGVISAFEGRFDIAFYLMLGASAMDFMDGFSARMLNAYSPVGKELDSLADMVSFGILPSMMAFLAMKGLAGHSGAIIYVPLAMAVFSALRLAKFNVDDSQSENFKGLATPAAAMISGSYVYYIYEVPDSILLKWASASCFIPVCAIILSFLMVSNIPMFSMKFKKGVSASSPIYRMRLGFLGVLIVCSVLVILIGLNWSMIVLLSFIIYVLMNIVSYLAGSGKN